MTKLLIILSAIVSLNAQAAEQMSCHDVETYQQDATGTGIFTKTDMAILIQDDTSGAFGLTATVSSKGQSALVADVLIETVAPTQMQSMRDMAALLLPTLDVSRIEMVRAGNVGVKANEDDSSGIMIYELQDSTGKILGKILTIGWSFARCSPGADGN